jgi:hypothetical protein
MTLYRSLAVAGWALQSALRQVAKPALWLPFLLIALLQIAGLEAFLAFYRSGVSIVALPLVRWLGGDAATHYPTFYVFLPVFFARWDTLLAVFAASLTTGAAVLLFARTYGEGTPSPWSTAARRYLALAGIALISALLSLAVFIPGEQTIHRVAGDRMLRWLARLGMMGVFVVAESFIIYASVAVVLEGRSFLRSLRDSVGTAAKLFVPTLVVVGIPVLLAFPLDYLTERSDLFLTKFRPELMTGVLFAKILAELVLGFLLVGAVTRIYLFRRGETA